MSKTMSNYYKDVVKVNPDQSLDWIKRKVRNDKGQVPNGAILETISSPAQGTVIIKQSWKDYDTKDPKATFTDMLHEGWIKDNEIKQKDPKGLKVIVQENIMPVTTFDSKGVKLNTCNAIDEVFAKLNHPRDQVLKLDAKSTNPDVKACYELMSSQTHVARPLQWLSDRHEPLGNAKVESLSLTTIESSIQQFQIAITLFR